MTDVVSHPTRVKAVRESLRTLRATEFPWTADTVYLNNASVGPLPERTRRLLDQFNAKRTAPHLLPDRDLFAALQAAREAVARLLNAETGEIALAVNTSYGLNLAARSLPIEPGEIVLVSDREFPANMYPWLMLEKRGVIIETVPTTKDGLPDEARILERLRDPKVRVLAISFVQFSNGFRADLKKLGAAARANGTYFVVDGIQGVGNLVRGCASASGHGARNRGPLRDRLVHDRIRRAVSRVEGPCAGRGNRTVTRAALRRVHALCTVEVLARSA